MKLSILIPTLNETRNINRLQRLRKILDPQVCKYHGQVEIVINDAGRSVPTGSKRNLLIKNSEGEYFCFIDDDDVVPEYYVEELLNAIEQGPDVITFIGHMTTDGKLRQDFTIKLGSDYVTKDDHHYRYPNHLCCFKRSVVEHIKFKPVWQQEDFMWATEIMIRKLLKSEVHIEKEMYWYDKEDYNKIEVPRGRNGRRVSTILRTKRRDKRRR
jgi:glycosyltransferase involved in cell wall biosynthesis